MKIKGYSVLSGWLIPVFIVFFTACSSDGQKREEKILFTQYRVQGQILYDQHCSNCHQVEGTGLKKLIPPLAGSDYLMENENEVICGIRYGMEGPMEINGVNYNFRMPANESLTNLEIAEILTYIKSEWGNSGNEIVKVSRVEEALEECSANQAFPIAP